jgi:ubiquinone/menaquinone biosynthesis C-methylase UbiE
MPRNDTTLHYDMLKTGMESRKITSRIKKALKILFNTGNPYGLEWGDPDVLPPLQYIRDHFLLPYIDEKTHVVEIGPGGGRWTRYMLNAGKIYALDYHQELLNELKKGMKKNNNITYIKNDGDDFPGITPGSIDFIFSFGTFVHLDVDIIERYLENMKLILKPNSQANVIIQYSDKTKPLGLKNDGFSENDPDKMKKLVLSKGYTIYEEDVKTLWHSSIIRFGLV